MAYNSDGYIMIDFTEVDFRRTNQTIDGLYKRCVDVIGTNKFILVINANGRTPLPATCSFINNQYVIDTVIYMFAVSSNDNLFIRRNDVPASDIIDDDSVSVNKTWSSNKIDAELDGKADTSSLADYQPLLTAVSPVSINADNEISVDLSDKQDVLSAGDNISIVNNVISAKGVKSFTYVGTGTTISSIHFPDKPIYILSIHGYLDGSNYCKVAPFSPNDDITYNMSMPDTLGTATTGRAMSLSFDDSTNILSLTGASSARALNVLGKSYTVYYI